MADLSKFAEYAKNFFLQRAAGYCLIILSSLFVIAPLGVLETRLDDECLLYAEVVHDQGNKSASAASPSASSSPSSPPSSSPSSGGGGGGQHSLVTRFHFGPSSVCEYNLAVSALFSLIYALVMVAVYLYGFRREKKNKDTDLGQLWFLVHGLVEVVVVVLMLVSACTISHGFTTLCSRITDTRLPAPYRVDSCSDAQNWSWLDYDISDFYVCLSVATAGSWFQFVFWLLQSGLVMWKLWRLNMLPVLPDWMKPGSSG